MLEPVDDKGTLPGRIVQLNDISVNFSCSDPWSFVIFQEPIDEKSSKTLITTLYSLKKIFGVLTLMEVMSSLQKFGENQNWTFEQSMNKYELTVVVSAKIEDDERAAVIEKCKSYIERFGGKVTNIDDQGKKKLAYEIQKMKEAFYYFIQFDADSTAPANIESRVRIMDNVLRFLIVRLDEE